MSTHVKLVRYNSAVLDEKVNEIHRVEITFNDFAQLEKFLSSRPTTHLVENNTIPFGLQEADRVLTWMHMQDELKSNIRFITHPYIIALVCRLSYSRCRNQQLNPFDPSLLPNNSWKKLYAYQRKDVEVCCVQKKQFLFLEMGLGKTCIAIMSALYHRRDHWPLLIVAPSSLLFNWRQELIKWSDEELTLEDVCLLRKGSDVEKKSFRQQKEVYIVSYSLLNSKKVLNALKEIEFDSCVLDECHYVKSAKSKRYKNCLQLTSDLSVKYMLSGTPFSYPIEMFSQMTILDNTVFPHLFHYRTSKNPGSFYFAERFTNPTLVRMGMRKHWEFKGYKNKQELSAVLSYLGIRRRKNQVLGQLPLKTRKLVYLTPSTGHASVVGRVNKILSRSSERKAKLRPEQKAYIEEHGERKNFDFSQAYQVTRKAKVIAVREYLKTFLKSSNERHIVFFHHQEMKNMCVELFDSEEFCETYFVIDGSTSKPHRDQYVNDFQTKNNYRIALLSITACATGLTLTSAYSIVFAELLFSPKENLQAEARCHRIGQDHPVIVRYLILPDTTDIICYNLVKSKEIKSSAILDASDNAHEFYIPENEERKHSNKRKCLSDGVHTAKRQRTQSHERSS